MKRGLWLCKWEAVLSTNLEICIGINVQKIQFDRFKFEWLPYELVFFLVLLTLWSLMQMKKDASKIYSNPEFAWHSWCKFETYFRLSMFVGDFFETYKGLQLKTEIESEGWKKAQVWLGRKKAEIILKKGSLQGILYGTCPLFLQIALMDSSGWLRHLSGIFFKWSF